MRKRRRPRTTTSAAAERRSARSCTAESGSSFPPALLRRSLRLGGQLGGPSLQAVPHRPPIAAAQSIPKLPTASPDLN